MSRLAVICMVLVVAVPVFAKDPIRVIEGVVTKVVDGDTVHVSDANGTSVKVRLYGIDAPETVVRIRKTGRVVKLGQPFGEEAESALRAKIFRRQVRVNVVSIDRYKRLVGIIWLGDRNINLEMVREGWAWAYWQYLDPEYKREFVLAEVEAKNADPRQGLWAEGHGVAVPPWEFRKSKVKR